MKFKLLTSIIIAIILTIMFYNVAYASGYSDVITGGDDFLNAGQSKANNIVNTTNMKATSNLIYNILLTTGIVVSVLITSILGIKFMIGSVEEKAQVKDALIPFVIGCIVIFGAFGIWKIFIQIGNNFIK